MLKATIKHLLPVLFITTLLFAAGCTSPEEKRQNLEADAKQLTENGDYEAALAILEELNGLYPNETDLLKAIGTVYSEMGDRSNAAFFLEQAHLQTPEDVELLYQTYASLVAAEQESGPMLEKLAEQSPESMSDELWITLGAYYASQNQTSTALEAFLKGADFEGRIPEPETSATIGQLFLQSDNLPMAANWFEIAANSDDPNALTALFGLLDIQLREKKWSEAEKVIERLEAQFPGAVDASQWKQAREELVQWREAQDRMRARLEKVSAEKRAAAEAAKKAEEAAAKRAAEAAEAQSEPEPTPTLAKTDASDDAEETAPTESKSEVVADLAAAEAMANMPAVEEEPVEPEITYDPSILIQPADPELSFNVTYDEQTESRETTYAISPNQPAIEPATPSQPAAQPSAPDLQIGRPLELPAAPEPRTFEELLADAETAELDRNYKSAIRKYWSAIGITNSRPDVWNRLARVYLVDGQLQNAETAALEAIRLEPNQINYTLDYLRVAQRSRPPEDFLAQLATAYDRFPANPELTLSLARAHERISKQPFTARNLYQRFIDIAPNHPLVPEAREAIERLQ